MSDEPTCATVCVIGAGSAAIEAIWTWPGLLARCLPLPLPFAFAFAPLAALVIIPLRARVVSALLRATLLLVKARSPRLR